MAKTKKDYPGLVERVVSQLLDRVGIEATVQVTEDKENDLYNVQVDTEDAGILIGRRGETIAALQAIVRQIAQTKLEQAAGLRVLLNVGDWRQKREEVLKNIATTTADRVRSSGTPQHIYDLTPAERRFIHIFLSSDQDVVTQSEGEGRTRYLIIKPK